MHNAVCWSMDNYKTNHFFPLFVIYYVTYWSKLSPSFLISPSISLYFDKIEQQFLIVTDLMFHSLNTRLLFFRDSMTTKVIFVEISICRIIHNAIIEFNTTLNAWFKCERLLSIGYTYISYPIWVMYQYW